MPSMKEIVEKMIKKGTPEAKIRENLTQLGMGDEEITGIFSEIKGVSPAPVPEIKPVGGDEFSIPEAELQEFLGEEKELELPEETVAPAPRGTNGFGARFDALEDHLVDLKANVGALSELNKQILETIKDVLIELKKK